jgi:multidrug efflux pump subunit AcrA (membrane-fusion protein)
VWNHDIDCGDSQIGSNLRYSFTTVLTIAVALGAAGCAKEQPAPLWEKVPAARRDLEVSVEASGAIEPVLTVDVKSKASGEIIDLRVETGEDVRSGQLLARIDPRLQQNTLAQADANLDVARAQLENAEAQKRRADQLYKLQTIAETEYENTNLTTRRRAPRSSVPRAISRTPAINGRHVAQGADRRHDPAEERRARHSSSRAPRRTSPAAPCCLRMANLDTMQVRALVMKTDIGKVQAVRAPR